MCKSFPIAANERITKIDFTHDILSQQNNFDLIFYSQYIGPTLGLFD